MFGLELLRNLFRPRPTPSINPLVGKSLRYLIGADDEVGPGEPDKVTVVPYRAHRVLHGISVGYCNLFDEEDTGRYGPYLHTSDTAEDYNEGQIDPRGVGWTKNLNEQFVQRKRQGFEYIELDNPDAYSIEDVIGAIDLAARYGLKVIAKNPLLMDGGAAEYVAHSNVFGAIVERACGQPDAMDRLRRNAGKPDMPVWFVSFGKGREWADNVASVIRKQFFREMRVTYSPEGEYETSVDIN